MSFHSAIWVVLLAAIATVSHAFAAATKRPNIVFLYADDQRVDTIRALGNEHIRTPNLDSLVRQGTAFTRAYCMGSMLGAVCIPSRAMLMTGRSLFRATESATNNIIPARLPMWPELFGRNGYRTFGVGKWHNDRASYNRAFQAGGPVFFGGMANQFKVPVFDYDPTGVYPPARRRTNEQFSTEVFVDAALEFLRQRSAEPFVLYVAFTVPHDPRTPPQTHNTYTAAEIPLPKNFLPRHPFDNGEMRVRDELLLPHPRAPDDVRRELAAYYGMITHMDAQIGRILDALQETGEASNTIVVFAGDNGLALGSHGLLGKQNLYEHSVRVPLVMAGPGIPRGLRNEAMCYLHDLFPTLCDLAGLDTPSAVEGQSLARLFKKSSGRETIFCAYKDVQRSIRDEQWKLIEYPRVGVTQLFHLRSDAEETNDLASDPKHADTIERLRGLRRAWQAQVSDPLEDTLPEPAPETDVVASTPLQASISVDVKRSEGRISPLLYGQFLEFMYEGIKGGLHAELLRNRSFEEAPNVLGLSRYWERYPDDRNDDYGLSFAWDGRVCYPKRAGEHSLRLEVTNAVISRHGVYQAGIPVRTNCDYVGYAWIRATNFRGRVTVALEEDRSDGAVYAEALLGAPGGQWEQFHFRLRPTRADPLARFAILMKGAGRIWVDQVSLMPGDATNGLRAEVMAKIAELKPSFIRWPGGNVAQDYRWPWGIGPRDQRYTWSNLSWKNEPEPSDFGTDEFIAFCRTLQAEPSITVNVEGRGATAKEAAAWVEYCNGGAESRFGRLRAAHGEAEPFRVKFWEIGNEIWGAWVRGHTDARTYARRAARYVAAMREVDPSIRCIAVGDNDLEWNRTVLKLVGNQIDYLAIHHYYTAQQTRNDRRNLMARPLYYDRFYGQMRELLRTLVPKRAIKLAINEWGLDLPMERQYSIESALYGARLMNVFERNNDLIDMTAVSDLVNGWPGGIIQASRQGLFVTPLYLANKLYAEHLGAVRLRTAVAGPAFNSSVEGTGVPCLDATASRSTDTNTIFIKMVNTHLARPLSVTLLLSNAPAVASADLHTLGAPSLQAMNGFNTPEAVSVTHTPLTPGSTVQVELPKHSVAVLKLGLRFE